MSKNSSFELLLDASALVRIIKGSPQAAAMVEALASVHLCVEAGANVLLSWAMPYGACCGAVSLR